MTPTPRTLLRVLALAGLPLAAGGPAGAAEYRSVQNVRPGHVAWIHRRPDAASARVGYLKAGATPVSTSGCHTLATGGWCQVTRRGTRGWVQDRYLKTGAVMRG